MNKLISANRFAIILTLLFAATAGIGMYNHEMWRDEFEIFMEMRDVPHFLALFPRIQPAPNLYYSLLYPIIKLWPYPASFQIFHLVVIIAAVFLFNMYSPFTKLQKTFFTFSYFVLFEYGIISRDYSMLLLLLFSLIYLITRENQNFVLIAAGLILLSNHHIYGAFFSIGIFTYLAFYLRRRAKELSAKEKRKLVLAGILLAVGSCYLILQYYLMLKFNRFAGIFEKAPMFMTIRSIWNAFFPIPNMKDIHIWDTNFLGFPHVYFKDTIAAGSISTGNILALTGSILVFLTGCVIFSRKPPVLAAFLVSSLFHLIFLQYLSVFFVRYQGPLFVIFIYCYWLLLRSEDRSPSGGIEVPAGFLSKTFFLNTREFASSYVTFLLFIQFFTGIFFYIQGARYPFTASYKAAEYIKEKQLDQDILVGHVDYVAQVISGHLNKQIYYPQSGEFGTYVKWLNKKRKNHLPISEVLEIAARLHYTNKKNVLLILNTALLDEQMYPIRDVPLYNNTRLIYLNEFTEGIVADERFYLYLIRS